MYPKALLPSICPPHTGCSSEANEICNFCINSIKIPIVMRIFANTIYLCVRADRARGRGMPDNMEVRQYRLTEYPIPVHSSHCSHDKGHLYASFGARFPGQCHKRLPLWSVVGLSWKGGVGEEGKRMAATEFSIWRQQHLHLPLSPITHHPPRPATAFAFGFALARTCRLPHNEMQFKCLWYKLLSQLPSSGQAAGGGGRRNVAKQRVL